MLFKKFITISLVILATLSGCEKEPQTNKAQSIQEGVITHDQGKIFYKRYGKGTPIILVHGGPGFLDHSYLLPQMLDLSKDHEVIFYDQRGSGKSIETPMDKEHINLDQFVKDLEALRAALKLDKFTLLGHSFGGFLGMKYAIKYQDKLNGLILVNSSPATYKGMVVFNENFMKAVQPVANEVQAIGIPEKFEKLTAGEITTLYQKLFSVYLSAPKNIDKLTLNFEEKPAKNGYMVYRIMTETSWFKEDINLLPELNQLKVPTLIVQGKDDFSPQWSADNIHAAIKDSTLININNCGHFAFIEQPHKLFESIRSFIKPPKQG